MLHCCYNVIGCYISTYIKDLLLINHKAKLFQSFVSTTISTLSKDWHGPLVIGLACDHIS